MQVFKVGDRVRHIKYRTDNFCGTVTAISPVLTVKYDSGLGSNGAGWEFLNPSIFESLPPDLDPRAAAKKEGELEPLEFVAPCSVVIRRTIPPCNVDITGHQRVTWEPFAMGIPGSWLLSNGEHRHSFGPEDVPRIHAELCALRDGKAEKAEELPVFPVITKRKGYTSPEFDPYAKCREADAAPLENAESALEHLVSAYIDAQWAVTGRCIYRDYDVNKLGSLREWSQQMRPLLRELERLLDRLGEGGR